MTFIVRPEFYNLIVHGNFGPLYQEVIVNGDPVCVGGGSLPLFMATGVVAGTGIFWLLQAYLIHNNLYHDRGRTRMYRFNDEIMHYLGKVIDHTIQRDKMAVDLNNMTQSQVPVSYTHLTLPTKRIV